MKYKYRLIRDMLKPKQEPVFLPGHARAILCLSGGLTIEHETGSQWLRDETGFTGNGEIAIHAGPEGAEYLRWELVSIGEEHDGRLRSAPKATSDALYSTEISLDPANSWLLRCDRVTFPAKTEAPWHMHQGPGLRYVLKGSIDAIGPGGKRSLHKPGDSFLENGVDEEVWGGMDPEVTTSFVRGLILPRMLKTRGSTRFVKPDDWGRVIGQTYEVFSESYIELPA